MLAITFTRTGVRADARTTQTELTAQFTAFMKPDFRAGSQTTTELTAQLTAFMRTDVPADAQTIIEPTAQLAELFDVLLLAPNPLVWGRFPEGVGSINWHH